MNTIDRIAFSHANMTSSELRKPLRAIFPDSHPGSTMDIAFYAWPFSEDQEPSHIIAKQGLSPEELAPMCRVEYDYILSEETAKIFAQFDLGKSTLKQIPILYEDGSEVPGTWSYLHIGERKETLVPTKADKVRGLSRKATTVSGPMWVKENSLPVEKSALKGPDLWRDPIWADAIFMGPRLATEIEASSSASKWDLARCRWATDQDRANRIITHDNSLSTPEYRLNQC